VIWQPGFGTNSTGLKRQLIGGWSLSSIFIAQNGSHYTGNVSSTTPPSVDYTGFTRGSTASTKFTYAPLDGGMGGTSITSPGAPNSGRIGWVVPGYFVLPNLYNIDLRLEKVFTISERYHIAIRGEAFNLFNTTLVQGVSQTASDYASPAAATASCWNGTPNAAVPAGTPIHTNTCMVPLSTFQQASTTSGNNLGARQLQAGFRFEF